MNKLLCRAASLLGVTALSLGMLTGCHGSRGMKAFEMPAAFDESKSYEIDFWAKNDTNKAQTLVYQKAIEDFEALYPNIHVDLRLYTDYGKIYNDVITNIQTGTTPNVCITYPDHIATYLTGSNVVAPLDGLMDDPAYGLGGQSLKFDSPQRDEIVPQFLSECSIGGQTYALPYMRSTEALYVNKTFLENMGYTLPEVVTWDFVFEAAEKAMEQNADGTYKVNGQKIMIPFIYKSTDNMMIQMLRQKNAGYSTEDGKIEIFNDMTRDILEMVAQHVETGAFSTFKISSYPGNFLNAGQCLFAVDSTAGATWMGADAPLADIPEDKKVDFETAVLPVPQFDPDHPQMISQGPSVCVFNKADPQEVMASWLFAQFLLTDDVQTGYAKTEGYVPVTLQAQESEAYQDYLAREGEDNDEHYQVKIDASHLLVDNSANTFIAPVFNGSTSLRTAAGQMIEEVAKSVRRGQTIDDSYIQSLYDKMVSLYRLDQLGTGGPRSGNGAEDLGPLPGTAKALIAILALAWVCIAGVGISRWIRRRDRA